MYPLNDQLYSISQNERHRMSHDHKYNLVVTIRRFSVLELMSTTVSHRMKMQSRLFYMNQKMCFGATKLMQPETIYSLAASSYLLEPNPYEVSVSNFVLNEEDHIKIYAPP